MQKKRCSKCGKKKPLDHFFNRKAAKDGKASCCKTCAKGMRERLVESRPYYQVHMQRQRKYGVSQEQYEEMLRQQGGRCAICRSKSPGRNSVFFCIDHDHETGRVRGLLCRRCNMGLGYFGDKLKLLRRAVRYLEENKS